MLHAIYARITMSIKINYNKLRTCLSFFDGINDGRVTTCPILPIGVTLDHRLVDGSGAAKLHKSFLKHIEGIQ